jgi:hypothetical protein
MYFVFKIFRTIANFAWFHFVHDPSCPRASNVSIPITGCGPMPLPTNTGVV